MIQISIELKKLNMSYENNTALKDFDLTVNDGEFIAILGPSGGGKSTILRIIAGLIIQDSGDVIIDGENMNQIHPSDRNVAMVFQNQALYPHMTVYNNIALNLKMKGLPKSKVEEKVNEVAKIVGIDHILDRKPKEISGGQAQRVGLARAMVRDPVVYLMDEPLSGLDAKFRDEMREELIKFHKLTGKTIIYVTHDQIEAMSMADRIVVINNGEKIQEGNPQTLYDEPEHVFVATFIGSPQMNIFDLSRKDESSNVFILDNRDDTESFGIEFKDEGLPDKLKIGIRPSDFILSETGEIEAKLEGHEFLGPSIQLKVRIGDSDILVSLSRDSKSVLNSFDLNPGSVIRFSVSKDSLYIFENDGARIKVSPSAVLSRDALYDKTRESD